MPVTLSPDIRTGYDSQTAFDIKLDTFNRMNEVFNRPSKDFGIDYFDPVAGRGVSSSTTTEQTTIPPIKISDALVSNDPKVRDLALSTMEKNAYSNPYARLNIGKEFRTPFNRGVDKFIDDKYGYDMFSDNEDFYYKNSYMDDGWFTRAMKNVLWRFPTRVIVGTATKFVEGAGYLGSMVTNGIIDGAKAFAGKEVHYWQDVADNTLSKVMKNANDDFRDFVVPVYRQAGFDEKGFFSQLGNYAFWNDTVADGVSFMASAFIPAGIASKAGWLAKGAGLGAEIGAEASVAARVGNALRAGFRGITGADTYGEAGLSIFNTANEAAFQATGQYSETKQQLLDERALGNNTYTDREIQELAGKAAASSFGWNFPALMVSNAWEMKNIIKPLAGRVKNTGVNTTRTILKDTGHLDFKAYKDNVFGKIAGSYVGKVTAKYAPIAFKGTMIEGFWEENIQNAIDRASRGEYKRFGDDTDSAGVMEKARGGFFGILEQYVSQTIDTLKGNDRENSLSIGVGGILGVAGGIGGAKFGRRINPVTGKTSFTLGERRQEQLATDVAIAETNNAYNNFLSTQDVRKEDGTIDENKLSSKVAAFESFAAKQEILDDLKTKGAFGNEELQMLQNKLLDNYVRGLAKVGKVQEAATRIQDLANRDVVSKGEKFFSNPIETANYITNAAKTYDEIQAKPNHTSDKYSPAQLEQINIAIKDRAFDLKSERDAIQPVLKKYEKNVQDRLTTLVDFLLNNTKLPQGEFIEQALAKTNAREYIEAVAKREIHSELLDKDAPGFVKDYHKSRIAEANNAIDVLNKTLGQSAPTIDKDGNVQFNDKVIDFKSKLLTDLLGAYKNAYRDQAELEFAQQHNEHIADSILDPEDGLQNWNDYIDYVGRAMTRQNVSTPATPQEFKVGEQTYPDKAALDKALVDKVITQEQYNTAVKTATTTPPVQATTEDDKDTTTEPDEEDSGDTVVTDEKQGSKGQRDEITINNPLSWLTPNTSSTDDTVEITEEGDIEQLVNSPYDEVRKTVIANIINDAEVNNKYKFFIVKDTFPQLYKAPAKILKEGEEPIVPSGQVIVMETLEGKRVTVNDILPGKYKDLADFPVVFSFRTDIFKNYKVAQRASIWADQKGSTTEAAYESYDNDNAINLEARELIKNDPTAKVQVSVIEATSGIMPVADKVVPVLQRFGDGFTLSVKTLDDKNFKKGSIVATFGKVAFQVGTAQLKSSGTEFANVQKILGNGTNIPAKQFDTLEEAQKVIRDYLNTMFYTNKETHTFRPKEVNGKYTIVFKRLDKNDMNLPKEKRKGSKKESFAYGDLRFNVSKKALDDGMNVYNPETNSFIAITPEEYMTFVKSKAVTSLKKTLDKDGNLYMKPVNAYFSFKVIDNKVSQVDDTVAVQKTNYDNFAAKVKQTIDNQQLTAKAIDSYKKELVTLLGKKAISQAQFDKLNGRLDTLKKDLKAKPAAKTKENKVEEKKAETKVPTPKTEEVEDDEDAKANEILNKAKGQEVKDVNKVLGNTANKAENKTYTASVGESNYVMNSETGIIRRAINKTKSLIIDETNKEFGKAIEALTQAYPFQKAKDGTISGMYRTELEAQEGKIIAYGLPIVGENDAFVGEDGKGIVSTTAEQQRISPVPFVKTLLTDKGKQQLEDFLNRNCK
jgi:hypothetical protein